MSRRLARAAALLAAAALMGSSTACETLDIGPFGLPESQSLYLDATYTPSNLPRGDYRLTNGQGDSLMEVNSLAPEQEHTATFDLEKLDGTINIVATKDGEEIYSQTVTHKPGTRVRLIWDIDLRRFLVIEDPEPPRTRARTQDGGGGGRD
jgi:hypothetical protein